MAMALVRAWRLVGGREHGHERQTPGRGPFLSLPCGSVQPSRAEALMANRQTHQEATQRTASEKQTRRLLFKNVGLVRLKERTKQNRGLPPQISIFLCWCFGICNARFQGTHQNYSLPRDHKAKHQTQEEQARAVCTATQEENCRPLACCDEGGGSCDAENEGRRHADKIPWV